MRHSALDKYLTGDYYDLYRGSWSTVGHLLKMAASVEAWAPTAGS